MALMITWIALVALSGAAIPEAREVEERLSATPVTCQVLKDWGKNSDGEPWLRFRVSCNLPAATEVLVAGLEPGELMASLEDEEARYTAAAAIAATGRFSELAAPERVRFVLELARREHEPFASASIGFVFGEIPWWEQEEAGFRASPQALGYLAAPWDPSMTPVIREYLVGHQEDRPASTLAVYLCTLMGPALGDDVLPYLEKIGRLEPDSLAGKMAREVLAKL